MTGTDSPNMLRDLEKLTGEELHTFMTSGAFTGFSEQDIAAVNEADKGKMQMFNELLRLQQEAKRLKERRRNLGQ